MHLSSQIPRWPFYSADEIEVVKSVLESGCVNSWTGSYTEEFESAFSAHVGSLYGIAISNGSLALSLCYQSLDLIKGDEIITTPRTFVATASSIVLSGAIPIFADVDLDSGNIGPSTIEPLITKRTKAISVVHLAGWPAEMPKIIELANSYNIPVVEDCAQAHGATIEGTSVGSFGDLSAWSFCQDKIMSTGGEGGMVLTNNENKFKYIWSFKDHGKGRDLCKQAPNISGGFRWLHENWGTNMRLTEMQSAIGLLQLQKLPDWNSLRTRNAMILHSTLKDLPGLRTPIPKHNYQHAWYKFYCYIELDYLNSGWSRDRIVSEINMLGYPAFTGSCPEVYLEKCFLNSQLSPKRRLRNAERLGIESLMFLVHPTIDSETMYRYATVIRNVVISSVQ